MAENRDGGGVIKDNTKKMRPVLASTLLALIFYASFSRGAF